MSFDKIWVVDFGGQYNQLIARRVREANVYAEIVPYEKAMERLETDELPKGIIFTGGPSSVYKDGAPALPPQFFDCGIPVLGICYGAQLMARTLGGKVVSPDFKEYGRVAITRGDTSGGEDVSSVLFDGIDLTNAYCWMSHTDYIETAPPGFDVMSHTDNCPTASMENAARGFYAVQFHPEVHHTPFGQALLRNFLYRACGCTGDWTMSSFAKEKIAEIRETVGSRKVLCALSGGVAVGYVDGELP
ncbi:MAG: glutamine-hydrolyzing GMP synthase, partial [Clostridiales Family XIII bacterium]|nr:glutamine-hydrolyzing GMP synthase [Clostridiales Family XIII bacterium]